MNWFASPKGFKSAVTFSLKGEFYQKKWPWKHLLEQVNELETEGGFYTQTRRMQTELEHVEVQTFSCRSHIPILGAESKPPLKRGQKVPSVYDATYPERMKMDSLYSLFRVWKKKLYELQSCLQETIISQQTSRCFLAKPQHHLWKGPSFHDTLGNLIRNLAHLLQHVGANRSKEFDLQHLHVESAL